MYQILARILKNNEVVLVADKKNKINIEEMKMTYKSSAQNAFEYAISKIDKKEPTIAVIPNGVSLICKTKSSKG